MSGPPGAGKSLLAACLPGILPPLQPSEALEVSMVASVAGEFDGAKFAAPGRSGLRITAPRCRRWSGAAGWARRDQPRPLGVLFLDELPEFQRPVLESLRQRLETGKVSVARANTQ